MNSIPVWLLFFSLFLPRLTLAFAFFVHQVPHTHIPDLIQLVMWALVPRVLILIYIYLHLGLGLWFVLHLVALVLVWGGSGHTASRRNR